MAMTTLVARDQDGAERVAAHLRAMGEPALACPVLAWEAVDAVPELPDVADVLVTSPRGADVLAHAFLSRHRGGWRLLALAGATAERLRSHGLEPDVLVSGGAASGARIARRGPLIHLTSDLGGAESFAVRPDRTLWIGYRTVCPDALPEPVQAALELGPYALWFGSPSAVHHLDRLAPGALGRAENVWAHGGTTLLALRDRHPRVIASLRVFPHVESEQTGA